jgi:hypothetical protein
MRFYNRQHRQYCGIDLHEGGRWHACTTIPGVMMISRPLSGLGLAIWREKENTFVGHDG